MAFATSRRSPACRSSSCSATARSPGSLKQAAALPTNLPPPASAFVGRRRTAGTGPCADLLPGRRRAQGRGVQGRRCWPSRPPMTPERADDSPASPPASVADLGPTGTPPPPDCPRILRDPMQQADGRTARDASPNTSIAATPWWCSTISRRCPGTCGSSDGWLDLRALAVALITKPEHARGVQRPRDPDRRAPPPPRSPSGPSAVRPWRGSPRGPGGGG